MGLMFYNGSLLFVGGAVAMSSACCCGGDCCGRLNPVGPTPAHLPEVLHVSISAVDCAGLDGATFDLTWSPVLLAWYVALGASSPFGLNGSTWTLECNTIEGQFTLTHTGVCSMTSAISEPGVVCNPLSMQFIFSSVSGVGCCSSDPMDMSIGTLTITVTE